MKTQTYLLVLSLILFFTSQSIIAQQDGTLDASFGDGGIVKTQLFKSNDVCNDAVKTTDNKIIAIGSTYNGTDKDIVLVRYNQDGTLDESFGNAGIVTTDIDGANDVATHVVIDQSGYIKISATSVKDGSTGYYILDYNTDGTINSSFGDQGKVRIPIEAKGITLATDNDILIAGITNKDGRHGPEDFTLIRYLSNGILNTSWGEGGNIVTDLGYNREVVKDIKTDSNGKFVVVGSVDWSLSKYTIVRYLDDGNLDSSFNESGILISDKMNFGVTLDFDSSNNIFVAGYKKYADGRAIKRVVKFKNNGSLDISFADDGFYTIYGDRNHKKGTVDIDLTIDNDQKIIITTFQFIAEGSYFNIPAEAIITKLTSNGQKDAKYLNGGSIVIPGNQIIAGHSSGNFVSPMHHNLIISENNKIILAGTSLNRGKVFQVIKFNNNGSLDDSFGNEGKVTTVVQKNNIQNYFIKGLELDSQNKIIISTKRWYVTGSSIPNSSSILRYNQDGTHDLSLGTDGSIPVADALGSLGALLLDGTGILLSTSGNTNYNWDDNDFVLRKFKNSGVVDSEFGYRYNSPQFHYKHSGYSNLPHITGDVSPTDIIKDNEGKIITIGRKENFKIVLSRHKYDGESDIKFGFHSGRGWIEPEIESSNPHAVVTNNNKIIIAGYISQSGRKLAIEKINPEYGRPDIAFGDSGIASIDFDADGIGITIDTQNRFIVLGKTWVTDREYNYSLIRFNEDGTLDQSFGADGIVSLPINAKDITTESSDKVIVVGDSNYSAIVLRYTVDGVLDDSFGNNGVSNIEITGGPEYATNVAIDNNGQIVVGAKYDFSIDDWVTSNTTFAIFRLNSSSEPPDKDYLTVTPTNRNVEKSAGSTTFSVSSNINWIANDDVHWLDLAPASGTGDATLEIVYDENTSSSSRTGIITVRGEGLTSNVTVIQAGQSDPPNGDDGTLDDTFGSDGFVKTSLGEKDYSFDSVIDPDGKLVSVGTTVTNDNPDFGIVRYNKDGSLDNSFGNQGKVITPFGYADDHARSVIIDKNGKIVVAGFTQVAHDVTDQFDFAIARYETNGTLDASFGSDGKVITSLGPDYDFGSSVVLDDSDKLIVVGLTEQSGQFDLGLIRYNSNGTVDASFGDNGKTTTQLGLPLKLTNNSAIGTDKMAVMDVDFPWIEILPDVVIDNDGRIVVAATALVDSKLICSVSRYNSNGTIDVTFGNNGIVTTSISNGADYSAEVLIDIQGKILLLANAENDFYFGFALVRYNENGSLDGSYGENGIADFGYARSRNTGKDAVIDSLGRVIVAVSNNIFNYMDDSLIMLYRVTENGYTDDSFDEDGIVETFFANTVLLPESINLQMSGKILVVGVTRDLFKKSPTEFLAVRYNGSTPPLGGGDTTIVDPGTGDDGELDLSYGNNGFAETSIVKYDYCYGSAIDSESRIILVGLSGGATEGFPVMRYTPSGKLDNSFGTNGIVRVEGLDVAYDVDIDSKGRIIAVGKTDNENTSGYDITVVRYLVDGTLDQSFGQNGIVLKNISYNDGATSVSIDKNDKIIITGYSHSKSQSINDDIVVRFNTDGTMDESFGVTGIVNIPAEGSYLLNRADVVIDNFDRIIIRTRTHSLYRLKDDGSFDISFGTNGFINTQPSVYSNTTSIDLSVDLEGKIVVLSNGGNGESFGAFLQRYNVDGSLDDNFGNNGITDVAWGDHLYIGKDLVIDSKGRILVTANYDEGEHTWAERGFSMLAYTEDGWTDDSFNDDGIVETAISGSGEYVEFIGIDPTGNILISGTKKYENGERNFFVAKYFGSTKVGKPGANVGSKDYAMNQNYPNPFNPTTVIRFKIPVDNNVTLKVFNMLGQEVATLVNEYKSAGLYKATFDATDLPSGIYIYRLDSGSFTEVHKMLLLK